MANHCPRCGRVLPADGAQRFCAECGAPLPTSSDSETVPGPPIPPAILKRRAETPSAGQFLPGVVVGGRYRMVGLIGRGGMGEVYRADDLKVGQPVALKFLPAEVEGDPDRLDRFLTEVRLSLRVSHPNVCRVFDLGQIEQRHFLSMEFVDGEDLSSLLRRIGRLPEDKAVEIARQLCAGLSAAHDEGVLHRDLKPANIMIDGRGRAKIADFGIASAADGITGRDARVGTPQYMAPEQASGGTLSERTDIYSLGLVLYEMFTGKRAFEVKSLDDLQRLAQATPVTPSAHVSGLNPLVERAILRCLDPDPEKRPASAAALASALPGGDPLSMAVAAGDTPSPEMVAAAGSDTGLAPRTASLLLAASFLGMIVVALLAGLLAFHTIGAPSKPPAVLIERSRELLQSIGFPADIGDSAWGFVTNRDYLNWTGEERTKAPMSVQSANALRFWYRESPQLIERRNFLNPYFLNTVWPFDPPISYADEVILWLDREGRLRLLMAIPREFPSSAEPAPRVLRWPELFKAAGLDIAGWRADLPQRTPGSYGDERFAWVPTETSPRSDHITRIEAASLQGRPTQFAVVFPWTTAPRDSGTIRSGQQRFSDLVGVLVMSSVMIAAVLVARRNVRLDRADRKGATRLALALMCLTATASVLDEHHVPSIWQLYLVVMDLGWVLLVSGLLAAFYLALEPYARRNWPWAIISWSRAISGAWRDSLVARDVLIGLVLGSLSTAILLLGTLLGSRMTGLLPNIDFPPAMLMGPRHAIAALIFTVIWSTFFSLFYVLALVGLRKLLRREWLAIAAASLILGAMNSIATPAPLLLLPFWIASNAVMFVMVARVGLVASVAAIFLSNALPTFPIAWPPNAWYSGIGLLGIATTAALAIAAFRISTRRIGSRAGRVAG